MAEMQGYDFKLFKDVFPDYQTFLDWYSQTPFATTFNKSPNIVTFNIIYNEYCVSHLAFSEEVFKCKFSNDIYTYFEDFEQESEAIKDLMALTSEDIVKAGSTVVNFADIPEKTSDTDAEVVDFVSQQQKTNMFRSELESKREVIRNKRELSVRRFLSRFRHLFMRIISPDYIKVYVEDKHE